MSAKRREGEGDRTFDTVRARYDAWESNRPPEARAEEPWAPRKPETEFTMEKMILTGIGVGTGLLLLILAGLSYWTAAGWSQFGREPGAIGYAVVGTFLVVAGVGCLAATLNHMLRVLDPRRARSHAHH